MTEDRKTNSDVAPEISRYGALSRIKNVLYKKFYPVERRIEVTAACRDACRTA